MGGLHTYSQRPGLLDEFVGSDHNKERQQTMPGFYRLLVRSEPAVGRQRDVLPRPPRAENESSARSYLVY